MHEEEGINRFCRAYTYAMLHLDAAGAMPAIGATLLNTRQELEKGCKLFPETVKAKVRNLYEHADVKRKEREARTGEGHAGSSTIRP